MDDAAFDRVVDQVTVYARTNPEQSSGSPSLEDARAVVAMTGDASMTRRPSSSPTPGSRWDHRHRGQQGSG